MSKQTYEAKREVEFKGVKYWVVIIFTQDPFFIDDFKVYTDNRIDKEHKVKFMEYNAETKAFTHFNSDLCNYVDGYTDGIPEQELIDDCEEIEQEPPSEEDMKSADADRRYHEHVDDNL